MLRDKYEVSIYDAEFYADSPVSLAVNLKEMNPDIVGFTSTLLTHDTTQECIKQIRKELPSIKIVVGGPQVTALPREELEKLDFDLCVLGECEGNIVDVFEQTGIVQGICIEDLDLIPSPSRDLLLASITEYKGNAPRHKRPETSTLWSRGCPHACTFCGNSVFGKRHIRYRTPLHIVNELKMLHEEYGIKSVFVYDDELLGQGPRQTAWLRHVLNFIIAEGLHKKMVFKCQARCNPKVFGLEEIKLMKKAGFRTIMWGIESGSPKVLKAMKKGITPDDVRTVFGWCRQVRMETYAFMMLGSWDENPEDIEMSKELMREIKPNWIQWTVCTPMHSTEFYDLVKDKIDTNQEGPTYFYDAVTGTNTMTREQIFIAYMDVKRDTILARYFGWKRKLALIYESIFTKIGRRVFRYRLSKYRRLKKDGLI